MTGDTQDVASKASTVFTIRNALGAVVAVLVIAIVAFNLIGAFGALSVRRQAANVVADNAVSDALLTSALSWAAERSTTNTALSSPNPVDVGQRQALDQQRETADSNYRAALQQLEDVDAFAQKQELIAEVGKLYKEVAELRSDVDRDLMVGADTRERRTARNFFKSSSDLINAAKDLRVGVDYAAAGENPKIATLQQLKHSLWVMSEFARREDAVIGAAIASAEPLSQIRLEVLATYRGNLESAWSNVQDQARAASLTPEALAAVEDVKKKFFEEFSHLRESVYAAAIAEEPYPVTGPQWLQKSKDAIGALLTLSDLAAEATRAVADDEASSANFSLVLQIVGLIVFLSIGAGAFWLVVRRVVAPLHQMTESMKHLAEGDLNVEIGGLDRRDEIGEMAASLQVFKENAVERDRLREEQRRAEEEARSAEESRKKEAEQRRRQEEERSRSIEEQKRKEEEEQRSRDEERERAERDRRRNEMLDLADQFEKKVLGLVQAVSTAAEQMQSSAQNMVDIADETTTNAGNVANSSQAANENVQTVASAAEELSGSVREISSQVNQSTQYVRTAVTETGNANEQIQGLLDAAQRIGDVVNLINDIASQTNLLALNATIEASRAGDAGRGFAVVASEVKNLANQTAKATEDISSQIAGIQSATEAAVEAIRGIGRTIDRIDEVAVAISSAVEEQDAATQEIARNVAAASAGTDDVSRSIAVVNQGASNTGAAAGQVLAVAENLSSQSRELKREVEEFVQQVRSA